MASSPASESRWSPEATGVAPPVVSRHIVLVGLMGSGKTTVGRALAQRLDRPFVDSDEMVEARTGRTVREIFEHEGEASFRAVEREVLAAALAAPQPAVIAAAGGVVLAGENREALRLSGAPVVWLRAEPAVLAGRVSPSVTTGHRPLLGDDPGGALVQMARDRAPLYGEVATLAIDVDERTPDDIVDAILAGVDA